MAVLSSLAKFEPARLDPDEWLPSDIEIPSLTIDSWGNHVVLILARVVKLLYRVRQGQIGGNCMSTMLEEWQKLFCLIQSHKRDQPMIVYPLAIHGPDSTNVKNPFQTACYISEAACLA